MFYELDFKVVLKAIEHFHTNKEIVSFNENSQQSKGDRTPQIQNIVWEVNFQTIPP